MLQIIKNSLLFIFIALFQIYFEASFFVKPALDFLLIFLIFILFNSSLLYLFLLLLIRGIFFDTLSGLNWGINLLSLLLSFGFGVMLTTRLESNNFFSRIIIGEVIINLYFVLLFIFYFLFSHLNIAVLILKDSLINSFAYLGLMIVSDFLKKKLKK